MLKGNRTTRIGKALLMAVMAGVGFWTTGCFHDHDDDHHAEHAGWHEHAGYDRGNDNGYDRGRDTGYDHDSR